MRNGKGLTIDSWNEIKNHNQVISRIRVVVEHAISRMKKFKVLSSRWRGDYDFLCSLVLAIANICNILIEFSPIKITEKIRIYNL